MSYRQIALCVVILTLFVAMLPGEGRGCDACGVASCGTTYVEQTVFCPQYVTETRMCTTTEYRNETRERKVVVHKRVAETAARTCEVTVMVPQQQTKTVSYTVQKPQTRTVSQQYNVSVPVWSEVEQNYTVQVPQVETRQANRVVCRRVPYTAMKTVCRDAGSWVNQSIQVPYCDPCGNTALRTVCRRVYVPQTVTEQVPVTCYKTEQVAEPFQYNVTVLKPETRTRTVRVCNYRTETRSRDVQVCEMVSVPMTKEVTYTCMVPQKQQRQYNVTTYRMIPQEQVEKYQVCVPYQVQKPVQVTVQRTVAKKILVPVGNACGACCL